VSESNYTALVSPYLDKVIAEALDTRRNAYKEGEFFSSAYHVLQIDEDETEITIYLLASHGWYNRATTLNMISGGGRYGVLRLRKENDLLTIVQYDEYIIKQILDTEGLFPVHSYEELMSISEKYFAVLEEVKRKKVIMHFGLGENRITHSTDEFELTLFSDKKVYKTTDAIQIWATLEYIGDKDFVTVWSGYPHIIFNITDGKDFNSGGWVWDVLIETVLEKDESYHYGYQKSGGFDADAPDASFWESFYQERNLYLPEGEYTISVHGAFSSVEPNGIRSGLLCELKIVVTL